ncbi:P27 family phage terminase small subunit [Bacillus sp. B-jedd]|uniref:P27 family phage terminase small subunit n=1 Tax=Bacillus sp. B-jedd TaxID=1476857 RepID=UPI00051554AD|nr:P27 family phage terminase small subunit [Bacillus sp. B-jedd]CEG28089.1 gp1 [Bacillus sp. B-jedd]
MKKSNIKKLEKELLSKIDTGSQKELEKVKRYINLVKLFYDLDESIERDGAMVLTENGSQRFLKPNPAIQEKNRINAQILSIERSFIFVNEDDMLDGSDLL